MRGYRMYFKQFLSNGMSWACLVFAAWAFVTISGCAPAPIENDTGCLTKAGPATIRYLDGNASELETAATWNCAIRSLKLFSERTQGEREGVYSPQELRAFLEKYFLDGAKVPDEFLAEAMELKRVMLGGSTQELTRADLESAGRLLELFREQALGLRLHMPLTLTSMQGRSADQVDAAIQALRTAAVTLGAKLEEAGVPYPFARLSALGSAIQKFQGASASPRLAQFQEKLPLIQALKSIFIRPESDRISGNEWTLTLSTAAEWYALGLRYAAMPEGSLAMSGEGRERAVLLVRGVFELIDQALSRQPGEQLPFSKIDTLIDLALPPQGLAVTDIRVVTRPHLKNFARPLIQRFLGGTEQGSRGRKAQGLTRQAWSRLRARFEHWNDGQRYLDTVFAQAGHGVRQVALSASDLRGMKVHEALKGSDAVRQIQQILRLDRPLFGGRVGQIRFDGHKHSGRRTHYDLTQANWTYALARLLMDGYADDPASAAKGDDLAEVVSFPAFERFVNDIAPISIDVKVIDPHDPLLAIKRFREASLFTYAGTGSGRISVQQAAQLLALMVSGKRLALQVHSEAIASGCKKLGPDPFGFDYIDPVCYRKNFFKQPEHFWKNMPKLAEYYRSLSGSERLSFEKDIETGARKLGYSREAINSSDSEGFAIIGQYVEVIFSRFDADDSGFLDWNEALEAFPVFQGSLQALSCQQGHCLDTEEDLLAVFTYMLARGHAPGTAGFLRWRYIPMGRKVYADRGTLVRIFGELGKPQAK